MASELRDLQQKINQKTDESLESTRRMVNLCEESQTVGANTMVQLGEQGEKLNRVEEGMTKINQDMKEAEKNLKDLEKCCGLCVLPWKRSRKVKENDSAWKSSETDGTKVVDQDQRKHPSSTANQQGPGYLTRITNDAREDEMEQNMIEVHGMIGNLKNLALDMNQEINSQNKQIDRINVQATTLDQRVTNANTRANKILKS